MTDEMLWPRLDAVIVAVIGASAPIGPTTRAQDVPGWNSHATVEIILAVEEEFGFQMSSLDMETIDGAASLMAVVLNYAGEAVAA
jgi:acyl carrier protein